MKNDKENSVSSLNINELQLNTTIWKVQVIALCVGPLQQFNGSRGPGKLCRFILANKEITVQKQKTHMITLANVHFLFEATIITLDNLDYPFYNACKKCNKKVKFDKEDGMLKCENCTEQETSYQPKYMVRLTASGEAKTTKLTLFEEAAEQIIGCKAKEFLQSQEKDKLTSPYYIKLVESKGKMYTFVIKNDEKNEEAITKGSMTVKEVYNLKKSRRNEVNDGQATGPFFNKKIKIEKE